jgi:hypothetical protein
MSASSATVGRGALDLDALERDAVRPLPDPSLNAIGA